MSTPRLPVGTSETHGRLLASTLAGSWRRHPSAADISVERLKGIEPLLLHSGTAGLCWGRLRQSPLKSSSSADPFRQTYRLQTLHADIYDRQIEEVFRVLKASGIDPILGKGWAVARHYPERGLRPSGDIDLYVHPDQYAMATAALQGSSAPWSSVDLHSGITLLRDRAFGDAYDRSQLVQLRNTEVRVFGQEDHLKLLCIHTLGHGAWRPLWFCDISVALESRSADFDWEYFLSGTPRRSDWAACAIGLAHQLLGADVDGTPLVNRARQLPKWLVPTALRQWREIRTPHGCRTPMSAYLKNPGGILQALRLRWPNGIEATVGVGAPFNEMPRLPFQVGECVARSARFIATLSKLLAS